MKAEKASKTKKPRRTFKEVICSRSLWKKIGKIAIILAVVAAVAVSVYFILRACGFTTVDDYLELRNNLGDSVWFWIIIGLLQIVQVIFIPISNQIVTVPLALIFPANELWKVWLSAWISIWIATLILYFVGRWGGDKLLKWILTDEEQVKKCEGFLKKHRNYYILLMILPFPDDVVTVLAGTCRFGFLYVLFASLFTRGLDTAISVFGFGLLAKYWWGWVVLIGGFVLLTLATILWGKCDKKKNAPIVKSNHKNRRK